MINDVWHNAYKMYSNGEGIICLLLYSHKKKNVILQSFIMFSFFNAEISGPNSVAFVYVFWSYKVKKVSNKVTSSVFIFILILNKLCTLKYLLR